MQHGSCRGKSGPVHFSGPSWAQPAQARKVDPVTRKEPLETPAGFRAERSRCASSSRATDAASPGDPPAGSTHAGLGGGRGNRQGRRAISTSSGKGWSPENRPYFNPGQEARRALSLSLSVHPCSLDLFSRARVSPCALGFAKSPLKLPPALGGVPSPARAPRAPEPSACEAG